MKKQFNSWGILFLYLIFIFVLDRLYLNSRFINSRDFYMDRVFLIKDIIQIFFIFVSLVFIYFSIIKNVDDVIFLSFQIVLGIFGAFFPLLFVISKFFQNLFRSFPGAYLIGSNLGILRIAFAFICGLGVIGLVRWKFGKEENR